MPDSTILLLHTLETSDSIQADERYSQIASIRNDLLKKGDTCLALTAEMLLVLPLNRMGMQDSSIALLLKLENHIVEKCDRNQLGKLISLMTTTLLQMGDYTRIDSISRAYPLDYLFPENDGGVDQISLMGNYGEVAAAMGDLERQYSFFTKGLELATELNDDFWKQKMLTNLGICHAKMDNLDSAYTCFNEAAIIGRRFNNTDDQIRDVINLANLDIMMGDPEAALYLMDSLSQVIDSIDGLETRTLFWYTMYDIHNELGNTEDALAYLSAYVSDRQELLDRERIQAVADMLEKYEAEKKAREIEQLTVQI